MEERPAGTINDMAPPPPPAASSDDDDSPPPIRPPPGAFLHQTHEGTYVVHVPKDQVYRVPPPENAAIAERYRNPADRGKGEGRLLRSRLFFGLTCLVGAAVITVLVFYISFLILSPRNPEFAVASALVKNGKGTLPREELDISLEATNPNRRVGIRYEGGGEAALLFKGKKIGAGKFPAFYQGGKESTVVRVAVLGTGSALPWEVERSISKGAKGGQAVTMVLTALVPVRMKVTAVNTWRNDLRVTCQFTVNSLRKGGRVTSQQCQAAVKG